MFHCRGGSRFDPGYGMKPQHCISSGGVGDCYRACIASVLEIPILDVPHFYELARNGDQGDACNLAREWLRSRDLAIFQCWADSQTSLKTVLDAYSRQNPDVAIILHGEAATIGTDINHAVVLLNGEIAHDPSGAGIAGPSIRSDNSGAEWWMEVIAPTASLKSRTGGQHDT
jgi:hypothetical protein